MGRGAGRNKSKKRDESGETTVEGGPTTESTAVRRSSRHSKAATAQDQDTASKHALAPKEKEPGQERANIKDAEKDTSVTPPTNTVATINDLPPEVLLAIAKLLVKKPKARRGRRNVPDEDTSTMRAMLASRARLVRDLLHLAHASPALFYKMKGPTFKPVWKHAYEIMRPKIKGDFAKTVDAFVSRRSSYEAIVATLSKMCCLRCLETPFDDAGGEEEIEIVWKLKSGVELSKESKEKTPSWATLEVSEQPAAPSKGKGKSRAAPAATASITLVASYNAITTRFWSSLPCFCCSWEPTVPDLYAEPMFVDCPVCSSRLGDFALCECGYMVVDCNQNCETHGCPVCCFAEDLVWGQPGESDLMCTKSYQEEVCTDDVLEEMGNDPDCQQM